MSKHRAVLVGDDVVLRIPVAEVRARVQEKTQRTETGCLKWTGATNQKGYGYLSFTLRAHQVAILLSGEELDATLEVLHSCDDRACVERSHISQGTHLKNMADCAARGRARSPHGEAVRTAKLTPEKVREIRALYASGDLSQNEIGKRFGVTQTVISRIVLRQTWSRVA